MNANEREVVVKVLVLVRGSTWVIEDEDGKPQNREQGAAKSEVRKMDQAMCGLVGWRLQR